MGSPVRVLFSTALPITLLFFAAHAFALQPADAPAAPTPVPTTAPAPSPAPPAAADDVEKRKTEAKERFLKGIELVQAENWDAALAEFLASRELYPTKVAVKNAATSLQQLKRYGDAISMYREMLQQFSSSMTPEEKKSTEDAIANLRSFVGEIDVETRERDSMVVIDGTQRGTTPLAEPIMVNAGTHTVRVSKEGFETFEAQVLVAGKQRKLVTAELKALSKTGTLAVRDADGAALDVVVDGAVVGHTPWQGLVAVGTHTVILRGKNQMGTPPSAATVFHNQTSTLTLRAVKLDAEIRVEPTPSNATVFVDGVQIGNGVWEGRLTSGVHKVEVISSGFAPFRRDVTLSTGQREVLRVPLERDLSSPMWRTGFVPHVYVELVGGIGWAPSFGGGADAACGRGECTDRSRPFGFLVGGRGGYALTSGLGIELFIGFMSVSESMTRNVTALGENGRTYTAQDYKDETTLSGPMAALSASYRLLEKTPLTFRVWAGAARMSARFSNAGTFSGIFSVDPAPAAPFDITVTQRASIPEESASIWVPFVGPEARFGYQVTKKLSFDIGLAVFVALPPDSERKGRNTLSRAGGRVAAIDEIDVSNDPRCGGNPCDARPGTLTLPAENGFGTFFLLAPTLGGRFDF